MNLSKKEHIVYFSDEKQDKINKIFDNVQSIGHLIINFVFTLFLIVVIILSKNIRLINLK